MGSSACENTNRYRAITEGWQVNQQEGAIPFQGRDAIAPIGFKVWFDQMQEKGLVLAATTIDGVHHTLHVEQGWVPTCQLMGELLEGGCCLRESART